MLYFWLSEKDGEARHEAGNSLNIGLVDDQIFAYSFYEVKDGSPLLGPGKSRAYDDFRLVAIAPSYTSLSYPRHNPAIDERRGVLSHAGKVILAEKNMPQTYQSLLSLAFNSAASPPAIVANTVPERQLSSKQTTGTRIIGRLPYPCHIN